MDRQRLPFILTAAYMAVASIASTYILSEAWHFGFFLAFAPTVLGLCHLLFFFVSLGAFALCFRPAGFSLAVLALASLNLLAAIKGAYLVPVWGIHFFILEVSISLTIATWVMVCLFRTSQQTRLLEFGPAARGSIRAVAMILPIPIMLYAAFSFYVCSADTPDALLQINGSTLANIEATKAFIACERFLFGNRRASHHLRFLCWKYCTLGKYQTAEIYSRLRVEQARKSPFTKRSIISSYHQLIEVLWHEGKEQEAQTEIAGMLAILAANGEYMDVLQNPMFGQYITSSYGEPAQTK